MSQISLKRLQQIIREELASASTESSSEPAAEAQSEVERSMAKVKFESEVKAAVADVYKALQKLEKLGNVKNQEEFKSIMSAVQKIDRNPSEYMGSGSASAADGMVSPAVGSDIVAKKVIKPTVKK
jgi:hypothetical protein